ncbi:MAG: PAS domain S-box protein [Acidobacteriia bacterium]|nr:PAS domain S-box protein [Terriglobia bacterium]
MAALFAALFAIYWAETAAAEADRIVVRAYDTRAELLQFHIFLLDADSAVTEYLASGRDRYLQSFATAGQSLELSLSRLASLVSGDPASAATIQEIGIAAREDLSVLGRLRAAEPNDREPLLERAEKLLEEIQARLGIINDAQQLRLIRALDYRDYSRQRLFRVVLVCGIVGPLGAFFVHLLLTGRMVRRLLVVGENARRLAHGLPLEPLPAGTDEIADLARQLEETAYLLSARERELRQSEGRYRELFDQAPIPYEEVDREGVVRRFNDAVCAMLKRPPGELLGRGAWEFLDPERQDGFRTALLTRIANGTDIEPFECDYQLDDGSRIRLEIRETLIRDEHGEGQGVCRSLLDVTERRLADIAARKVAQYALELRNKNEQLGRALEAARAAAVAKSRFLAAVSHELRTPLNGIIGFSELLYDGKLGEVSGDQRDILGDILSSARHLLHLINDILDLSKVEAGKMEFRPEPSDIDALVNEVCDVVRPLADKKSLRLSCAATAGFRAVTDPGRFKQILYNYLSNAVKFTADGGRVMVRVAAYGDGLFRVEVEDTGLGIAAEDLPQLFQEFQQLSSGRKAELGTGLGLALTRRIVESQGGRVEVRSLPGQGSVFSAVLPLKPAAAAAG